MNARVVVFALLVVAAGGAIAARSRQPADNSRLAWVATAHQFGPVGYRDPAAAISPDGRWVAYSEGRFLRVQSIAGGPAIEFPPGDAQIRHLTWSADSRTIAANGDVRAGWVAYDRLSRTRMPLWGAREELTAKAKDGFTSTARPIQIRQIAWSPDGRLIAGVVDVRDGSELWTIAAAGSSARVEARTPGISFPAWTPRGEVVCIVTANGRSRLTLPCGGAALRTDPDFDAYGPLAVAPDGATVYGALASRPGMVDLWAIPIRFGAAQRLTAFSRDTYAPSVAADGTILFKSQVYRTAVAIAAADGGPTRALAEFQSETPSWDPTGRWIGLTYGAWRRVVDDAKYPDIAQDVGIIAADSDRPASAPARVVHDSESEDQSLCWSPNGRWIAFHSHKEQSDDVWLRPADADAAATRITFLGRGAETGWPRWSPDGHAIVFTATNARTQTVAMFVIGVDQTTGRITTPAQPIAIDGFSGNVMHVEWLPDNEHVAVIGRERAGAYVIFTATKAGRDVHIVHRFANEHAATLTIKSAFQNCRRRLVVQAFRPYHAGLRAGLKTGPYRQRRLRESASKDGRHAQPESRTNSLAARR